MQSIFAYYYREEFESIGIKEWFEIYCEHGLAI